ncbi:hypothetical protein SteCoe_1159 [Stentor coeruleus]|uniref:Uncharacterized protein n=1 Tax=Stentor coeruleus TaxID=5963 RepID=A0A1R2D2C9_9CILI|nr:hypothetical protein SteCoe_1159 [Stentor coeruleus]
MCNLNIKCQVWDGSCGCCKKSDPTAVKLFPVPFVSNSDPSILFTLFRIITQQNEMIRKIAEQTRSSLEKITSIEHNLESSQSISSCSSENSTNSSQLMNFLCGSNPQHIYFLNLLSDAPSPAYKERAFSLLLQIVDSNGNKTTLPERVVFSLSLFSTESPPKLILVNTSGEKIMRGTVDVDGSGTVFFRKIVLKEVSSHFRNGHFFLVIAPKDNVYIKPLIIENLVVKARKITAGNICKKAKTQETIESIYD